MYIIFVVVTIGGDDRNSTKQKEYKSTSVGVKKNKVTKDSKKMDTSKEEDFSTKDEEELDWLRDCFEDLLTANS